MNKTIILVAAVLSTIFTAPAFAGEYPQYDLTIQVDPEAKKVSAQEQVSFTNTTNKPVNEIVFHIYPNRRYTPKEIDFIQRYSAYFKVNFFPDGFQDSPMRFSNVTADGKTASYTIEGDDKTLLKIALDSPLAPGQTINLAMAFDFVLPHAYGRFGWHENIIKLSHWYPILAVLTDEGWSTAPFYPFHRPFFSEASKYNVVLTVSVNQTVIHTGELAQTTENGQQKTLTIQTALPVREFTLAMSPDYRVTEDQYQGIKLHSYYLPGDEARGQQALTIIKDLMTFYEKRFGPYPYQEFSVAPVPLGYGGEQMSNMIFIDTRAYQLPGFLDRYFDFLIAHETGHQWFYNLVGMDEYSEMWLEEGANSYFMEQYLENKYGPDAEILQYPDWAKPLCSHLPKLTFRQTRDFRYKLISRIGWDHAVASKLSSFSEPSSIFSVAYGKGSRIYGMLKFYIGEEKFNEVFRRIFAQYQHKNLSIADFRRISEEVNGAQLNWFFDPWLGSADRLDYAVSRQDKHKFRIKQRGGIKAPVPVRITYADGTEENILWGDDPSEQESLDLSGRGDVKQVRLDPDSQLLDIDRTNNNWPRMIDVKAVPLYVGLYDIPVFMKEDAYNFVVGPELANGGIGVKAALHKPYDQMLYAGTDYEFGESLHHSRVGYQLKNLFQTPTTFGLEVANTNDLKDDGTDDLTSGKMFLRRELWPAQYSITSLNDHASLYLLRNRNLKDTSDFTLREDVRNLDYSRRNESIVGVNLHLDRSGPFPSPNHGYTIDTMTENAGHFLEATQSFNRSAVDMSFYQAIIPNHIMALRLKYGWGFPNDKELFYLGGMTGLRGFKLKDIRGAKGLLGSVEYRFPIRHDLKYGFLDHILGLQAVDGVMFFDAGQAWFRDIEDADLKKNAGLGLRFTVNIGSFLEQTVVRADVAKAINDDEDTQFWLGVNQAF